MGFLNTYRGKIILTAFIGIQIPLIVIIYYFCLSTVFFEKNIVLNSNLNLVSLFLAILIADILGTSIVLYAIYYLLKPIALNSKTLNQYLEDNQLDRLAIDIVRDTNTLIADTDATLEQLERIIQYLVERDTLTRLPNRELFQTYIREAICKAGEERQFALIVLDLNGLKDINSTLGRQVGDLLLTKVAQRLKNVIDRNDTLARFGGDEFAILHTSLTNSDCTIALCTKLLASLAQPFFLYGKKVHCDAKIGITTYPFDGITVEQLIQNADTAVYQAKQQNLNTYQFYSPTIARQLKRILDIKEKLRYALVNQEFSIYYQPRIEIASNRLVGIEALLRWYNPELGWVSPTEFIPIAEESNLIIPIGKWVLYNACLQNKQWQQRELPPLKISVNLSACQFKQENLVETIKNILIKTELDATYLELEITESIFIEDSDRAIAILGELKNQGISIALDDFGTGYSSLSYLQKLPLNTLKVDRCFVNNIASNPDDRAISKAIVALAKSLELNITAEGVETKTQLQYLQDRGCHEAQGFYFSKPLSTKAIEDFLITYLAKSSTR